MKRYAFLITAMSLNLACADMWTLHTIDNSSQGADGVRMADVNGDGFQDITTGWEEGHVTRVYLHPGHENVKVPWPRVTVGQVQSPEDAVFADIDNDGSVDVLSSCEGKSRSIYVHWAPAAAGDYLKEAAWNTEVIPATASKQSWMYALPMELDGHPGLDFLVASKGGGASIGLLRTGRNPRDTASWTYTRLYDAGWIMSLEAFDLDADGDLDVVATDRKGKNAGMLWLENPGEDLDEWKVHRVGGAGQQVMFLDVADLNQDHRPELLTVVPKSDLLIFKTDDTVDKPWSLTRHTLPPGKIGTAKAIRAGDINLDGRIDLVYSCENARRPRIGLFWLSYPELTLHDISGPIGLKYDHIKLLDLDGDGDLDVISCEERDQLGVFWYENPTR